MGKKTEITKGVISFVASIGAGIIVGNAVSATTPITTKLIPLIFIRTGAFALGGAAGTVASKYVDETIDELTAAATGVKQAVEQAEQAGDVQPSATA